MCTRCPGRTASAPRRASPAVPPARPLWLTRRRGCAPRLRAQGDEYEDYFYWLCCGPCTLCQETRTLSHNNVEDGVWPDHGERAPIMAQPKQA